MAAYAFARLRWRGRLGLRVSGSVPQVLGKPCTQPGQLLLLPVQPLTKLVQSSAEPADDAAGYGPDGMEQHPAQPLRAPPRSREGARRRA